MKDGLVEGLLFGAVLFADLLGIVWVALTLYFHPAPVARRISLRAMARDVLLNERPRLRWARIARDLRERHRVVTEVAPFLVLGLILFLPDVVGEIPTLSETFAGTESSEDFLQTMWQVVAGALGLSVAMIAFAFEAFFSSSQRQVGGSLREFAGETRLLVVVRLGVAALLMDGLVLLGVGYEAPMGWAALWATFLSATTLLGVPYVLSKVVKALEVDELLRMRRKRLRQTVAEAMWQQLIGQAADSILLQTPELGVRRELFKPRAEVTLKPETEGIVRDVHLGALARLAVVRAAPGKDVSVSLLVGLGTRVSPQSEVLGMAVDSHGWARRWAMRAVRIEGSGAPSAERRLLDQLGRLHSEGTVTLRDGRVEDWRPIGDLYRLVLYELIRAAKRHAVPFEGAVAAPGFFGFGPAQRISGYLRDELEEAVRTESADGADAVAYLPGMISREALEEGALSVAKEMLDLYPAMYVIGRTYKPEQNRAAGLALDRATHYLLEYDIHVEDPFREPTSTKADRLQAMRLGRALFLRINTILKLALEDGDMPTFRDLESKWANLLEDEMGYVSDAARQGEATPPSLASYRLVLTLGLAMWSARLYAKAASSGPAKEDPRVESLLILASRFDDPEALLNTHEKAIDREQDDERGVPWSTWFTHEFGEGMHAIPTESELLFTTLLILVGRSDFDLDSVELKPRTWQRHPEQDTEAAVQRLREEADRWSAVFDVPVEAGVGVEEGADWGSRVSRVETMLEEAAAAAEEQRRAEIRAAPLDASKVEEFRTTLLAEAGEGRVIRDLFATQGGLRVHDERPEGERIIIPQFLSKGLFTAPTYVHGLANAARSIGRQTRASEPKALAEVLEAIEIQPFEGDLATRLREAIHEMAGGDYPATLLLVPTSWRLREALGLEPWGRPELIDSELVPLAHRGEFAGTFERIPVLDVAGVPAERLWLVNLPEVASFLEWPSERDTGFLLELKDFDPEEAAEMLAEHPEIRGEDEGPEQALKTLQEKVFVKLVFCWQIEPGQTNAGISLAVPEDLQR
jgi:hypothetical protein